MLYYLMMIQSSINEDSGNFIFSSDEMGFLCVDLNNINLDNVNFYEDCPETIIHVRLLAWCNIFQLCKTFQKELSKECSMDWSMSKDEKKETYF